MVSTPKTPQRAITTFFHSHHLSADAANILPTGRYHSKRLGYPTSLPPQPFFIGIDFFDFLSEGRAPGVQNQNIAILGVGWVE